MWLASSEPRSQVPGQGLIEFAWQFRRLFDQGGHDAFGVLVGDLDPRITKATPGPAGKPYRHLFWARFRAGLTPLPSLFPDWPEGLMEALPKLRDLTWEPPEFRPALYLQTALDRAPSTPLQTTGEVHFPNRPLRRLPTRGGRSLRPLCRTAEQAVDRSRAR